MVTGDGRDVEGRDPATGDRAVELRPRPRPVRGHLGVPLRGRGLPRCPRLRPGQHRSTRKTGKRGPARTAYADPEVTLSSDGTTVLSAGDSRLELWRSDMVRMLSYGALDARIKPGIPASPLCRLVSAAASSTAVSVLEACPDEADLRLTLLRPGRRGRHPELKYVPQPGVSDDSGARVIAVSDTTTAVYVPTPKPAVNIVDETGATIASTPLPTPAVAARPTHVAGR